MQNSRERMHESLNYLQFGDFELSIGKHETLISGGVVGTIQRMAPELLNLNSNMVYGPGLCYFELQAFSFFQFNQLWHMIIDIIVSFPSTGKTG